MTLPAHHTKNNKTKSITKNDRSGLFWINLAVLLLTGLVASAWMLHFTTWFPEFSGLLALGGIFSWVAFVSKVIDPKRLDALQKGVDTALIHPATLPVMLSVAAFGVLFTSFWGTVEVLPVMDNRDRAVYIWRASSAEPKEPEHLTPGGRIRTQYFSLWWSSAKCRLRVTGFPEIPVVVKGWRTTPVYVPGSLYRPVVLVLPPPQRLAVIDPKTMTIVVTSYANEKPEAPMGPTYCIPFDGRTACLGCAEDFDIPEHKAQELRDRAKQFTEADKKLRNASSYWLRTVPVPQLVHAEDRTPGSRCYEATLETKIGDEYKQRAKSADRVCKGRAGPDTYITELFLENIPDSNEIPERKSAAVVGSK